MSKSNVHATSSAAGSRAANKWSKESPAGQLLKEMLTNGRIQQTDVPKKIWEMDDLFQEYPLTIFRAALNRAKQEVGFHTRENVLASDKRLASANNFVTPENKNMKFEPNEDGAAGIELLKNDEHVWRPPMIVANWEDSNLTSSTTVVLMIPGGVADSDTKNVKLSVEDEGLTLVAKVKVPEVMRDMDILHQHFAKNDPRRTTDDFVIRKQSLKMEVSKMIEFSDADLTMVARIPLGELPMMEKIHHVEAIANNGSRILMIDLKGPESNYQKLDVKAFKLE